MSDWNDILGDIKHRYLFLTRLDVCGSEQLSSPLPEVLQISTGIADGLLGKETEFNRLAMIFPLLLDCPEWIAVGCSLAAIKRDFLPAIKSLAPFRLGQKLLLDGKDVVEYAGEKKFGGTPFLFMKMSAKSKSGRRPSYTMKGFPVTEKLRFQPTDTKRPLTPIENIDSQPSDHPLDRLVGIKCFGNRSIFKNRVLLVSRLTRVRQFAEQTYIVNPCSPEGPVPLRDLFQWGGITIEGELEQWGHQRIEAEPVLAVAPDLITLREYLSNRPPSDVLIILDSSIPFVNDLQALEEILDRGHPVLTVMENRNLDDLKHLEDRSFRTWTWSAHELQQFEFTDSVDLTNRQMPFRHFHRTVQNYSVREIKEKVCDRSGLDSAAERLQMFKEQSRSDDPEVGIIERRFYHCLLNLSRLLRPFGVEDAVRRDQNLKILLEQAQADVADKTVWLNSDAVATAIEFVEDVRALMENPDSISDKVKELKKLLYNTAKKNLSAVVLADASEVPITESYWRDILPSQHNIQFVTSSGLNFEGNCDQLIVCGWLGAERMRELFDSCISPSITVLMYPFEREWLRSALRRWHREKRVELTLRQKAGILRTKPENLPIIKELDKEKLLVLPPRTDFDIAEFELRLHTYRRALYARPSSSGETVQARFVAFPHDTYAYLRPMHKIPVVTDFIAGHADESAEIPSRDVSQLKVGDYVIFREGSDSDLLRDLADGALARAGKGEHREVAALWKRALRSFVFHHQEGVEGALINLWDGGLERSEVTIRGWMNDEYRIGPLDEKDIEVIAHVTGNHELQGQLEYVRRAIKEVRGAHRQAARFLAQRLIAQLPQLLQQGLDESHTIEIEDIGRAVVVRVEDIGDEDIEVPVTEVNRLLGAISNGPDDSSSL